MTFHDIQFPTTLSQSYEGGPGFRTDIVETDGGHEERIARWAEARRTWRAAREFATQSEAAELVRFFLARQGALHSFRWRDWTDYTSNADGVAEPTHIDQACGTVDGSTVQFTLYKTYTSGSQSYPRRIRLPVSGTIKIGVSGSEVLSGWSYNAATGIITFTSAPEATPTAGFEFDCEARFGVEADRGFTSRLDAYNVATVANIPIVEVKDESPFHEMRDPGGGRSETLTSSVTLAFSDYQARLWLVNTASLSCYLPAPAAQMGTGGPFFTLKNSGSSTQSLTLRDDAGGSIATLAAGAVARCFVLDDGSGNRTWEVF